MIKYPGPLKPGDLIGITAPSSGVTGIMAAKMDNAKNQLREMGYRFIETESVRQQQKLTSAPANIRAREFSSLYLDESIKAIIPPWGGEFLMDILPYLDFDRLAKAGPKWVLGFSDTSTLLFALTLKLKIATAHGPNLLDFGSTPIDESVLETLNILSKGKGQGFIQTALKQYQKEWLEVTEDDFPPYNLTEKVEWRSLYGSDNVDFSGRLIGGNLDVICKLIGTPFDLVHKFSDSFKSEGLIWYFESCEMNSTDIYRTLWQMKHNGWFENCNGFLFGRAAGYTDVGDFNLNDALGFPLRELGFPVIYDLDLGHLPPQLTFINGAYAAVSLNGAKGQIKQELI